MQPAEQQEFDNEFIPIGTTLLNGTYTITDHLGEGGFGLTYLADDQIGRKVVIKECFPANVCRRQSGKVRPQTRSHQGDFEKLIQTFIGEARQLAKLKSPNVVPVHHFFEENGTAYMSLEYIEGDSLATLAEDNRTSLTPERVLDLSRALVEALDYIHSRGVIHRDIAPDNIIVSEDGTPVLIDFGAARNEVAQTVTRLLSQNLSAVKDGYSPQEFYISGEPHTPASDLYSLAATLYTVITGDVPPTANLRLVAMTRQDPDPLRPLEGNVTGYPEAFLHALDQSLSVFAQDRPKSARDLAKLMTEGARAPRPAPVSKDLGAQGATGEKPARPAGTETALRFYADTPTGAQGEPGKAMPDRVRATGEAEAPAKAEPAVPAAANTDAKPRFGMVAAMVAIAIPVIGAGAYFALGTDGVAVEESKPAVVATATSTPAVETAAAPQAAAPMAAATEAVETEEAVSEPTPSVPEVLLAEAPAEEPTTVAGELRGEGGWSASSPLALRAGQDADGAASVVFAGGTGSPYPAGTVLLEIGGTAVGQDLDAVGPSIMGYYAKNDPETPGLPVKVSNPVFGSLATAQLAIEVTRELSFGTFSVRQSASDDKWQLTVFSADDSSGLQGGDVLIGEKSTGRTLLRATDLNDLLSQYRRVGRPEAEILVERNGIPVLVRFAMENLTIAGL